MPRGPIRGYVKSDVPGTIKNKQGTYSVDKAYATGKGIAETVKQASDAIKGGVKAVGKAFNVPLQPGATTRSGKPVGPAKREPVTDRMNRLIGGGSVGNAISNPLKAAVDVIKKAKKTREEGDATYSRLQEIKNTMPNLRSQKDIDYANKMNKTTNSGRGIK